MISCLLRLSLVETRSRVSMLAHCGLEVRKKRLFTAVKRLSMFANGRTIVFGSVGTKQYVNGDKIVSAVQCRFECINAAGTSTNTCTWSRFRDVVSENRHSMECYQLEHNVLSELESALRYNAFHGCYRREHIV